MMSVYPQSQRPEVVTDSPIYQQVIRRVRRAIVLVTVFASLSAIALSLSSGLNNEQGNRLDALDSFRARIIAQFSETFDELRSAASSSFARTYDELASDQTLSGASLRNLRETQVDLMRLFNSLIERNPLRYKSIAYVTRDGRVWGQASNVNGLVLLTPDVRRRAEAEFDSAYNAIVASDDSFSSALSEIKTAADGAAYVSLYVPIAQQGLQLSQGLLQADVYLASLVAPINELNRESVFARANRRILILKNDGKVIGSSLPDPTDESVMGGLFAGQPQAVSSLVNGRKVYSTLEVNPYNGADMPWRLVIEDDWLSGIAGPLLRALLIAFVVMGFMWVTYRAVDRALRAVIARFAYAASIARGTAHDAPLQGDEIDQVIASLETSAKRTSELTQRVEREIRRRIRDIEVAARIGRETATLTDIDDLLNRAIELITSELGFYHAQVFLVDDARQNAVLVYSHGEAGRQLLARGHKIGIGTATVVGQAAATARPVVINDTASGEGTHAFNALLAATRAEMALPLIIGKQVIGVLDVQSTEPNVFHEEDLPAYSLLADQLAVAINKAHLLKDTQQRLDEINRLNRQYTQAAWQDVRTEGTPAYRYDLLKVETLDAPPAPNTQSYTVPIEIRGQPIGALAAIPSRNQRLSEGDKAIMRAVSDRVALAIENARLFQQTQEALNETSGLYQLTRYLNAANSLSEVLQAVIVSIIRDADGGQVWVFDEYVDAPSYAEIRTDLAMNERDEADQDMSGTRIRFEDHLFLAHLPTDSVTIIRDIECDSRLDTDLLLLFRRMKARSVVLIPLTVRGNWIGLIVVVFEDIRDFDEREGRIFSAIIDQAGIAIDNRLLFEQTERALQRNENLYSASRTINQAQSFADLVRAVALTSDRALSFHLALLEGDLDETGWPTQARLVAASRAGIVQEHNIVQPIAIPRDSSIRLRSPKIIPNCDQECADLPILEMPEHGFMAVFPLFSANQPIALFYFTAPHGYQLSSDDEETYRALTGQMSTQIENRRLLESTERSLDETRRLYNASRAIISAKDLDSVFKIVTAELAKPLNELTIQSGVTYSLAILLAQPDPVPDAVYLLCTGAWTNGPADEWLTLNSFVDNEGARFANLIEHLGTPIVADIQKLQLDGYMHEAQLWMADFGLRGVALLPITSRGVWFGFLLIGSPQPKALDERFIRFADSVVSQLGITLENQRLFQNAQREAERAQQEAQRALALAQAAQLASSITNYETNIDSTAWLEDILARIVPVTGYDRWLLALLDASGETLQTVVYNIPRVKGEEADETRSYALNENNLISAAARRNTAFMVNNLGEYESVQSMPEPRRSNLIAKMGKFVAAPISFGTQVLGTLVAGRALNTPDLEESDIRLVSTLAAQIAVAIENRSLFSKAANQQKTLQSILSTLPAGVLVLDPQTLIPTIYNQQAFEFLGEPLAEGLPLTAVNYGLYRSGTRIVYPDDEMPVYIALQNEQEASNDDLVVVRSDAEINLLMNAAPIYDDRGQMSAIVATITDVTNLRVLESTLQDNLRDTMAMLEAQRQLSEAEDLKAVLDVIDVRLTMMQPTDAYVLLTNPRDRSLRIERMLLGAIEDPNLLSDLLITDQILRVQDIKNHKLAPEVKTVLMERGVRSLMSVPMRASNRDYPLGWLVVISDQPNGLTLENERLLTQLGDMAATAIDNRLLIRSTRAALAETDQLYRATTSISRARDLVSLAEVVENVLKSLDPEVYTVFNASSAFVQETILEHGDEAALLRAATARYRIPEDGLFIEDLYTLEPSDELERDLKIAGGEVRALGVIPYRIGAADNGRILVGYLYPREFSEADRRLLSAITESLAVVLDNIVLVSEIQSALQETTALYQANQSLANVSGVEDILYTVTNYIIAEDFSQVMIIMLKGSSWDSPRATAVVEAYWGRGLSSRKGQVFDASKFPLWHQIATGNIVAYEDVLNAPELTEIERIAFENYDARSVIIIPLRVPNRMIGAVWVSSSKPYRYSDRELRVYQSFGEQASIAMQAHYLLLQTERRARQLETTAEISQAVGKILDLEKLLPMIVDLIRDAFGYDQAQIFLMDKDDEYAELRASTGEAGRILLANRHRLAKGSQSVVGQATLRGEAFVARDTLDADVVHKPNIYLPLTRSELALPLLIKGKVVGVLDVQSNVPDAFSDEDISALNTLAAQISIAIDNASLYREAQQQADRMSMLFETTLAATMADTLNLALDKACEQLYGAQSGLSCVGIYLKRDYVDRRQRSYGVLELESLSGIPREEANDAPIRIDTSTHLLAQLARGGRSLIIDDLNDEPMYVPIANNARSALIAALISGNELLGMIVMESSAVAAFDADSLQLMLTLANSLSAIIKSTLLLDQVKKANEELRELDRLKSDFLANMSHELRTPLNSIIGFSRVMLKGIDGPLTEMQEQDLTTIYNGGQHLLALINDILDQAKIAAGKMDIKPSRFEIKSVIDVVKSMAIGYMKDKPLQLYVEVEPNLPKVYADEIRLRQVLINLMSNAIKFTNEGSVTLRVYRTRHEENGREYVRIDVIDTGIGIAEKDLPLLFEAFRQVDSSLTRTVGGTGLGLPIAKSLIEMMGGEMFVHSVVNVGSTFSVIVPTETPPQPVKTGDDSGTSHGVEAEAIAQNHRPANESRETRTVPRVDFKPHQMAVKRQILLIEDNPDMVDQFRRTLQREGFEVLAASIPLEAEAMASGLHPTLIVMDVNFAKGQGWDILQRLKGRDDTLDIPIIVVTLSNEADRALAYGAREVIQRPFMPETLVKAVLDAEKEANTQRILIIDDQPEAVRLIKQLLDEHGKYRVFAAHSGTEGIALVARRRPDLVILDLRMPEMDGFSVLNELRSNPETSNIPVMVVTGDLNLNDSERSLLKHIRVVPKTDLNDGAYQAFIESVQGHLSGK